MSNTLEGLNSILRAKRESIFRNPLANEKFPINLYYYYLSIGEDKNIIEYAIKRCKEIDLSKSDQGDAFLGLTKDTLDVLFDLNIITSKVTTTLSDDVVYKLLSYCFSEMEQFELELLVEKHTPDRKYKCYSADLFNAVFHHILNTREKDHIYLDTQMLLWRIEEAINNADINKLELQKKYLEITEKTEYKIKQEALKKEINEAIEKGKHEELIRLNLKQVTLENDFWEITEGKQNYQSELWSIQTEIRELNKLYNEIQNYDLNSDNNKKTRPTGTLTIYNKEEIALIFLLLQKHGVLGKKKDGIKQEFIAQAMALSTNARQGPEEFRKIFSGLRRNAEDSRTKEVNISENSIEKILISFNKIVQELNEIKKTNKFQD